MRANLSLFQRLLPGARRAPVYDFPGGVHPAEHKTVSNRTPIAPGPRPAQLVLPLNMHLGAPARPIVAVGDRVLKGQMLAEPAGAVSAALHAPTSGTVVALGPRPIQHPSGMDALCIVLEPDGEDRWAERRPVADHTRLGPGKLIALLRDAGVAGLGGAGFPTSVKVNLGDHQRVEQLIINAVECEPYITADDRLMRERADEIVLGIQILQYLLNPHDTLIGVEDNKPEAIAALRAACADSDVEVRVVPTKYPSGGEKQLIQLLTGKEVPSGSIPAQCGVVCQNVGTAWAVKRAVHDGEPLLSRITTVTGDAVARPGNYEVWLGTPVADLLHHAGVDKERLGRLVMGGPMMGFTLHDPSVPVVKTSNCVIAASAEELPEPPPEQACIRCGACAEVCPANLLPQQLYWYAKTDDFERAQHHNLMDCIECGACAYVCPSHIPLVQYYRYAKGEIRTQTAEQIKADRARERFEARQARLEREQAEKEARRRARLEANRKKQEAATDSGAGDEKLVALKKEVGQASSAYKAAVKAAKTAEAQEADNAAELRARADSLKAEADRAKAALRDAKAAAPAPAAAPAAPAPSTQDKDTAAEQPAAAGATPDAKAAGDDQAAAKRQKRLKALKTAYNMAHKQYKEAHAAVERAERAGQESDEALAAMHAKVEKLKAKADHCRDALDALVEQAKADILAHTGKDLKTLKLDAARAESALRDKADELERRRDTSDADTLETLNSELDALQEHAQLTRLALKTAVEEQGLVEE
ncbi:MAG: electron transport complex subunit RsxC [Alloalcanivorax venustensis]|uniref:electron transport complex subunit RsxC n=1 Tax=Alloalcanivorax venustensis TaxID=172371 RepID=UPI003C550CC2